MVEDNSSERNGAGATSGPISDSPAPSPRRDLVVVEPAVKARRRLPRSRLIDTLFVAHMVATRFQAPQTREKRRADPADANASYRTAAKARKPPTGLIVSRKI